MTNRPTWRGGDPNWADGPSPKRTAVQVDTSGLLINGDAVNKSWERLSPILKGTLTGGAGMSLSEEQAGQVCDIYGNKLRELINNSELTLGGFGKSMRAFEKEKLVEELAFLNDPTLVTQVIDKCVDVRRTLEQNMGRGLSPAHSDGMRK